jgi:hypothetical protein
MTFLLTPFWQWFEKYTGVEAIGHSGPSLWCYVSIFILLVFSYIALIFVREKK